MDVKSIMDAFEKETNESLMSLTTKKIVEMNYNILKELHLDNKTTMDYLKKLTDYRYVDEIDEIKLGAFIKWIPIIDPDNLPLHYSGIICAINITDNGIFIRCKNFMHRHYTFKMEECLIFVKLSDQEKVILSVLDHLENEK